VNPATPRTTLLVSPESGKWIVKNVGQAVILAEFARKGAAIHWAREAAKSSKPSSLRVHGKDGQIQAEYNYGKPPRRSKV